MIITKRDGTEEEFSRLKIKQAIQDAFCACDSCIEDTDIDDLIDDIQIWNYETVEDIQSQIIEVLSSCDSEVATAYIKYRAKKELAREQITTVQNYINNYTSSNNNAATASNTDDNANVTMKNVANLDSELPKSDNRDIQRAFMKSELNKLYSGTGLGKQYEKDLQSHIIYAHDEASKRIPENYCEAVSLYPLILNGSSTLDNVGTKTPTHLQSFCGQLVNATFLLAGQCKGAVAFGEFFNFLDYYCTLDYGKNYPEKENLPADSSYVINPQTIGKKIENAFEQIVYNWNQPAGNRGHQSPFTNISYYDSNYWKALFEDFVFPDGSKPKWERVNYLQKKFMKWFNKERTKTLLTFPVNYKSAA